MEQWIAALLALAVSFLCLQEMGCVLASHGRHAGGDNDSPLKSDIGDDGAPSPRAGHGMDSWDMYVGEVYLFGGCTGMNDTGQFAGLAMWHGCMQFSNEAWKMLWEEHSGQISWWKLWTQPNNSLATGTGQVTSSSETGHYPVARAGSSVVGFDRAGSGSGVTTLFVFGGVSTQSGPTLADTWFFDTDRHTWTAVDGPAPAHRAYHSTVHWHDLMIVFGGLQASFDKFIEYAFITDLAIFNTTSQRWYSFPDHASPTMHWDREGKCLGLPRPASRDLENSPQARAYHAASVHSSEKNTMFLYGGSAGSGRFYEDVFFDDLWTLSWDDAESLVAGKATWRQLTPSAESTRPPSLFGHTMTWCNGSELAMFWGMTPNSTAPGNATATRQVWKLDLRNTRWLAPAGLYEPARAFFAFTPIGCGGWLSEGIASFGTQPKLLGDFEDAGVVPDTASAFP